MIVQFANMGSGIESAMTPLRLIIQAVFNLSIYGKIGASRLQFKSLLFTVTGTGTTLPDSVRGGTSTTSPLPFP